MADFGRSRRRSWLCEAQERPEALLALGEDKRTTSHDVASLATWTLISSAILNLDEVLTH